MSKTCARSFAVSLAVLFLGSAVLAQEPEKKTRVVTTPPTADCEPNTCISKLVYLPEFSTAYELQEVVNTFRAVAEFTNIYPKQSDHTIAVKGTPEQLAVAEKLLSVLESLRSSGGQDRSSVLIYALESDVLGAAELERILGHPPSPPTVCKVTTCYIKVLYLPDLSVPQLQDLTTRVRTTAGISRVMPIKSRHVLVIRGTSEQVARAEKLSMNTSAP